MEQRTNRSACRKKFSTVWKHFFHCVKKTGKSFPYCGKVRWTAGMRSFLVFPKRTGSIPSCSPGILAHSETAGKPYFPIEQNGWPKAGRSGKKGRAWPAGRFFAGRYIFREAAGWTCGRPTPIPWRPRLPAGCSKPIMPPDPATGSGTVTVQCGGSLGDGAPAGSPFSWGAGWTIHLNGHPLRQVEVT